MNLPNMKEARVRNKSKIEYIYQDNIINKELFNGTYRKKKKQTQTLIRSDIDHSYRSPL